MNNPYETLDVPKNASKDTIKKAYRKKAQKSHPDKGGDPAEFQELAGAYALLSDDASRDRFDKTGQTSRDQSDNLLPELAQLLMGAISCVPDVSTTDVIALMNTELDDRVRRLNAERAQVAREVEKFRNPCRRPHANGNAWPPCIQRRSLNRDPRLGVSLTEQKRKQPLTPDIFVK